MSDERTVGIAALLTQSFMLAEVAGGKPFGAQEDEAFCSGRLW